ncbi:MAG TPA: amylo-alpha-1,6-glucosidase [Candidatus Acidoferrales bacterium]|nr:amylo-alpha-1,6-glucosidase [Candidatus Acidoferrales bacterium]
MTPAAGERLVRFVGDRVRFTLHAGPPLPKPAPTGGTPGGWRGLLRTNLGRNPARRREIIAAHAGGTGQAGTSWHDIPMQKNGDAWEIELPLAEAGFFKAKPYVLDARGWQHWPEGPDVGISVHPDFCRTANTVYCAFTRLFGATRAAAVAVDPQLNFQLAPFDSQGYTVIPPSGKLRDLTRQLPHIVQTLGCRILHLMPVHPTPTTYARFGRFGSPYAALDLTAIDPALAEFDHRTTAIDQFCELTAATHALGARVFLDIVINHTGWGAVLQENHPEFFLRDPSGAFASPGAWGVTWGDLVELKQDGVVLWDIIAEALVTWCRRGVDGYRCDAGYKIPVPAWQYIIARVQEEFPEAIFLLEGLGGSWEATENLLTEGGMQWAYSELFQNYSGREVATYLDYALRQSARVGLYLHYSETHDNERLAKRGRAWSLLRNRLCALTSLSGGFGFTCGVEWLAAEKIKVHDCTGLAWDSPDNLVPDLAQLNRLLTSHPCFFDGAKLTRLSAPDSPVYALLRESAEDKDAVLVLVNTDVETENSITFTNPEPWVRACEFELLGQPLPKMVVAGDQIMISLPAGTCYCLAPTLPPHGLNGDTYRRLRAQAAWATAVLGKIVPAEAIDNADWRQLAEQVERSPKDFLAAAAAFAACGAKTPLSQLLSDCESQSVYSRVIVWTLLDHRRITPVPPGHWLLIEESAPFRATLKIRNGNGTGPTPQHVQSIAVRNSYVACFPPRSEAAAADLVLERYAATSQRVSAALRFLPVEPEFETGNPGPQDLVLLTNGRGGMARLCVDLGRVNSKYDCVLGANLHPGVPVDRHVLVKRIRAWVNADGFLSPLDAKSLSSFQAGPPAVWQFVADAGDGRTVEIQLGAEMPADKNTTILQFSRPTAERASGKQLPADADVRLTVRFDIEDRNFHQETKRNGDADYHFSNNIHTLAEAGCVTPTGFSFTPAPDRQLRVFADAGEYHPQPEWCENIPHPVEQSRGQTGSGDAYSPGWFEIPLPKGANVTLVVTAERDESPHPAPGHRLSDPQGERRGEGCAQESQFQKRLLHAARQFVVRRDQGKTVIAGYPWFLDWGRDTLICARGLLADGMTEDVRQILLTFAKFEKDGTLPNAIYGDDTANRDTSDAPLWFALACDDFSQVAPDDFYSAPVDTGRTLREVLASIARSYSHGTANGIGMDADSALIWSPGHFTWMDTNHPAGSPREGYPVEIQVLWIRLLRQLERISAPAEQGKWRNLANQATTSFERLYWLGDRGWFADVLFAGPRVIARDATPSDALRSNCLFPVSLGLVTGERAKRCVEAARKYLVVPGGVRSLAPLPVSVPLPVRGNDGGLLNNPVEPYWPRYEGHEDARRKPAYHNGTAWTWTFPIFCEALARAWDFDPDAVATAKAYLGSMEKLMNEGCLGQIPEILDGDAPHTPRGCDAQAWGATEALRVWKLLNRH